MYVFSKRRPFKTDTVKNISSKGKTRESQEKQKQISKRDFAWKSLKCVTFIVCSASFLYQAELFWEEYCKYPTSTNIRVTNPKILKKPAVTVCNPNPVQRSVFCIENAHLCQTPSNLKEFCKKHPYYCQGNVSKLVIPKLGYHASDKTWDVRSAVARYLFNDKETSRSLFQQLVTHNTNKPIINVRKLFTRDFMGFTDIKCFSLNLHIISELDPDVAIVDIYQNEKDTVRKKKFYDFLLTMKRDETFFPWAAPEAFVSVHSPFVPVNPFYESEILKSGNKYAISVSLMCQELCNMVFSQNCYGCHKNVLMYDIPNVVCPYLHGTECENIQELREINLGCKEDCKIECVKLKFDYKVEETSLSDLPLWFASLANLTDVIYVAVQAEDLDVVEIRHTPLYVNEDLFSFIGGLMGCWLGISIFTFTSIIESVFQTTVRFTEIWKKKRVSSDKGIVLYTE